MCYDFSRSCFFEKRLVMPLREDHPLETRLSSLVSSLYPSKIVFLLVDNTIPLQMIWSRRMFTLRMSF